MRKLSTDLIKSGSFTGSFSGSLIGSVQSSSYALTSSYVTNGFSLTTGSTYQITSSWSINSISSSYSNRSISSSYSTTASNLSPITQDLIPFTGSTYSLGSPTNKWKDLYVSTGSVYIGEVVLSTSGSTLYANVNPIVTLNTASGQIEISGISTSLSASYSNTSSISLNSISSSFSLSGSYTLTSSYAINASSSIVSISTTSASYSSTSSIALNSLTSSYINIATNAVSSSYANTSSISISSSFSTNAITASYNLNSISSSFSSTSSYVLNSISSSYSTTASYAMNSGGGGGTTLTTGSTYPITSSWSNNSISSSYTTFAVSATSATSANSANTATSASYATVAGSATSATSATSANSATSASYSLSSSYSVNSTTATSSSFASTASYNLNSISSSFATNALTASYVANSVSSSYALTASYAMNGGGGGGTTLTTGSTYPITSSWSNNTITASYALNSSGGGSTPVVSVASLNNQTILYNFSSSQEATITGLTLTNNNWGVSVVEEWNSASVAGDQYYNSSSVLLHFSGSNGSTTIIDNSLNNVTFTVNGNSQISTAQSKFGGSSLYLDGSGDYLSSPSVSNFSFGTGDFTIECWSYRISGNDNGILQISSTSGGLQANLTTNLAIYSSVSGRVGIYANNNYYTSTAFTNTTTTWNHYAIVRSSGVTKFYLNGNLVTDIGTSGAITDTTNYTGTYLAIGGYYSTSYLWYGYIDELRITKGVARYTSNFSEPSSAFPDNTGSSQIETKYIGSVGGLNDSNVDYGIQKLDDTSLKIRKMSVSGTPISGSSTLSASVDRVYVNVLNYSNISVGSSLLGQTFTAVGSTSSYALSRSVVNPYEIVVAVDGAIQSFNDAYSVTSSIINFTESIPSGSLVDIRYLTTPNVNSASYATTSSYSLSGGTTSGKSIALSFILG